MKFRRNFYYAAGKIRKLHVVLYKPDLIFQQLEFFFIQKIFVPPIYATKQVYWKSSYLLRLYRRDSQENQVQQTGVMVQKEFLFSMPFVALIPFMKEQLISFNAVVKENRWFFNG